MTDAELRVILEPRVDKGIAFLDERMPGWRNKIDLEALSMYSGCDCIVGQLYNGEYCNGLQDLGMLSKDSREDQYGFDVEYNPDFSVTLLHPYRILAQIWKEKLQKGDKHGVA